MRLAVPRSMTGFRAERAPTNEVQGTPYALVGDPFPWEFPLDTHPSRRYFPLP